jgi:hypothetical protein
MGGEAKAPNPEFLMTVRVLDRRIPGWAGGLTVLLSGRDIAATMTALARALKMSVEDLSQLPVWKLFRYVKFVQAMNRKNV